MNCPFCKEEIVETLQASGPTERSARTNDFSFCADCGEWAVLEGGDLRKPNDDDYEFIAASKHAQRIRELWLLAQQGEPETLADKWQEYSDRLPKLPPRGALLCESAFMAGAFSFFAIQRAAAKQEGENSVRIATEMMCDELEAFAELKAKEGGA